MPNILIVDDEPLQRLLIREILSTDLSLKFFEAVSGAQAIRLTQRYRPQTIIVGYRAPGLDKVQVYDRLRTGLDGRPIPVIVTTTSPRTDPRIKMLLATGHTILVKPFEPEDLQAAVCHALLRAGVPSPVL